MCKESYSQMETVKKRFEKRLEADPNVSLKVGYVAVMDPVIVRASAILDGSKSYDFNLKEISNPVSKNDHLINPDKPEHFAPAYFRVGVRKVATANVVNGMAIDGEQPIMWYPDLNYFDGTNEAAAVQALLNGLMSATSDGFQIWKDRPISLGTKTPDTQFDPATSTLPARGCDCPCEGFQPMWTDFWFNGTKEHIITVDSANVDSAILAGQEGTDNTVVASSQNVLVIEFKGWMYREALNATSSNACVLPPLAA